MLVPNSRCCWQVTSPTSKSFHQHIWSQHRCNPKVIINNSYPFDCIEQKSGTIWMIFCPCDDWLWMVTIDCCLCHHVKGNTEFLGNEIFDNRIITRFLISKFIGWEGNNSETIFLIFVVKFL